MKKSKIFMGLGALVLIVSSTIASKANKTFSIPVTLYYYSGGWQFALGACSSERLATTVNGAGHSTAKIDTKTLYYFVSGTTYHTAYFQ